MTTQLSQPFICLQQQTQPNSEPNNTQQSHLIDLSSYYHMTTENHRMAPICSHAQQCTVTCLSHEKGKTIKRLQCAAMHSNHMPQRIGATNKNNRQSGTIVVNLYLVHGEPGVYKDELAHPLLLFPILNLLCISLHLAHKYK